jgi:hypothetical protein
MINPANCSILFGAGCLDTNKNRVKEILNVENTTVGEKYLGLPTPEGRVNKDKFSSIKERLIKRFTNWVERNMSSAAKEVLIKAVAQAIPAYTMGVFMLPTMLCDEMTQLIWYFWWGEEAGHRKVHWVAWDKLLLLKGLGGMDFGDLRCFNQALLARQAWQLIQFPESLYARVLKTRYYPRDELVDTSFSGEPSPT